MFLKEKINKQLLENFENQGEGLLIREITHDRIQVAKEKINPSLEIKIKPVIIVRRNDISMSVINCRTNLRDKNLTGKKNNQRL